MTKSLALIVDETSKIERMLVESDGELTPEIEAFFEVNKEELTQKVDNYSIVMEKLEAHEAFYKQRAERYSKAAKTLKNSRERLKENIKRAILALETDEVAGEEVRFKLQKLKPKLVIENEELVKQNFSKQVVTTEVDKEKLLEVMAFEPVEGASLEPNFALKTYNVTDIKKVSGGK